MSTSRQPRRAARRTALQAEAEQVSAAGPLSIPRDAHRVRSLPRLSAPSSLLPLRCCFRSGLLRADSHSAAARAQQRLLEQLKDITDGIASNSLSLEQLETLRMLGGQDGLTRAVDKCVASAKLRRRCLL